MREPRGADLTNLFVYAILLTAKEFERDFEMKLKYKMELYVYPVALCGSDLQKGKPLEVTSEGKDLHELKCSANEQVLSVMTSKGYDGECFVEMRITCNEQYVDCDEWWSEVDTVNKKVMRGRYD